MDSFGRLVEANVQWIQIRRIVIIIAIYVVVVVVRRLHCVIYCHTIWRWLTAQFVLCPYFGEIVILIPGDSPRISPSRGQNVKS